MPAIIAGSGDRPDKLGVTSSVLSSGENPQTFFQRLFEGSQAARLALQGSGSAPTTSAAITSGDKVTLRHRPQLANGSFGAWIEGSCSLLAGTDTMTVDGDAQVLAGLRLLSGRRRRGRAARGRTGPPARW